MISAVWILLLVQGLAIVVAPRRMALLIWPVILLYPQNLFYDVLPYNAGLDDIFVLLLGARLLLSRDRRRSSSYRQVVILAVALWLMQTLAEGTGVLRYPDSLPEMVKTALKGVVVVVFAGVMSQVVRTQKEIELFTTSFLISIVAAFIVVVLCFIDPLLGQYWEVTTFVEDDRFRLGAEWRAFGPLLGPAAAGLMVCLMVALGLGILLHRPQRLLHRALAVAGIILALAVLLVCKSRSAIVGLGGMFVLMSIISRRRLGIVVLMVIGALVGTYFAYNNVGELAGALGSRLESGVLDEAFDVRMEHWQTVVANPSPAILLFSEGLPALVRRLDVAPHNGYLDVIFLWGLGGIIIFWMLYSRLFKWSRRVAKEDPHPLSRGLAWGLIWATAAIAIYALTADPWYITNYRFATYFLLTIVWVRYHRLQGCGVRPGGKAAGLRLGAVR